MKAQTLVLRISQCIDDLGLLLDHIYKFPQKERENYFEKIQTMKNKLLTLKTTIRQSNTSIVQKQYKQLYLATNSLKQEIQHQQVLGPSSKENKEPWRCKDMKQMRKEHQQTMRIIVSKDQEIRQLKNLLFSKQEVIKLNQQELRTIKNDYQQLIQSNRLNKYEFSSYQLEIQKLNAIIARYDEDIIEFKIREEEKDKAFAEALQELERLKTQLINANQTIYSLEYNAEVNAKKAEENFRLSQKNIKGINQANKFQENDCFKHIRALAQLELQVKSQRDRLFEEQQKTKHLKEDIQVLENEVKKLEGQKVSLKEQLRREKQMLIYEKGLIEKQGQRSLVRENELRRLLNEADKKYLVAINKLNVAQEYSSKLLECQSQKQILTDKIISFESTFQKLNQRIASLQRQRDTLHQKLENQSVSSREMEVQVFRLREKGKMKEEETMQLTKTLERYKDRIREYEKELDSKQKKEKVIESNLICEKEKLIKLQEKQKAKNKQIQGLKVKLLRAKIQTIHQIRSTITQ